MSFPRLPKNRDYYSENNKLYRYNQKFNTWLLIDDVDAEINKVSDFIKKLPIEIQNIIRTDFEGIISEYQNIFKRRIREKRNLNSFNLFFRFT